MRIRFPHPSINKHFLGKFVFWKTRERCSVYSIGFTVQQVVLLYKFNCRCAQPSSTYLDRNNGVKFSLIPLWQSWHDWIWKKSEVTWRLVVSLWKSCTVDPLIFKSVQHFQFFVRYTLTRDVCVIYLILCTCLVPFPFRLKRLAYNPYWISRERKNRLPAVNLPPNTLKIVLRCLIFIRSLYLRLGQSSGADDHLKPWNRIHKYWNNKPDHKVCSVSFTPLFITIKYSI